MGLFLLKCNELGNFIWVKNICSNPQGILPAIVCDQNENIYISESFSKSVDFDPSASTFNLTSTGSSNAFISKIDKNGNFNAG
jgi:hypothetical protein